ncbi:MAG: hypothetical protein WB816_08825 [Methylocystis sp.]
MKLPTMVIVTMLASSTAYADNIVIGCPLTKLYSEADVNMLLTKARSIISEQEIAQIYNRYVVLKNACQTNSNASRVVPVSATLRNWLAQNGVNISRLGRQL